MSNSLGAILLYLTACALGFLEIFIPSHGLLTLMAVACAGASVYIAFLWSAAAGFVFLGLTVIGGPILVMVYIKIFPHTPFGRMVMLADPSPELNRPQFADLDLKTLVGQSGVSQSDLRPAGLVLVAGRRVDVVTEGSYIEKGRPVRVVKVEGQRVIVREEQAAAG